MTGVDLSAANVAEANARAAAHGFAERVTFLAADAERLPFDPASFDAIVCECAFCTFPDKARAAAEFARVLRPQGRVGISDLTRSAAPLPDLDGLLAWVACIGDAQPLDRYADWLRGAGFRRNDPRTARRMLARHGNEHSREAAAGRSDDRPEEASAAGLRLLAEAKRLAGAADRAVKSEQLGYALLVGELRR